MKLYALAGMVTMAGCSGANGQFDDPEDTELAEVKAAVQRDGVNTSETSTSKWINMLSTSSNERFNVIYDPAGSCGFTFISKHYGVTAAHCTTDIALNQPNQLILSKVMTTNLNVQEALDASVVTGPWNDSIGYQINDALVSSDGYSQTIHFCTLIYRCASGFGPRSCAPLDNPIKEVDISLVYCPNRPAPLTFLPVDGGDPTSGNVEVWWFHEMLDLQEFQNDPEDNSPPNNWDHYGYYAGDKSQNFHYKHALSFQYLPLLSRTWNDGTPYKIIANTHNSTYTDTDVPACHGTSGSGTFIQGSTGLLGDMPFGYTANAEDRLCDRFSDSGKNVRHTGYVNAPNTMKLRQSSLVAGDL